MKNEEKATTNPEIIEQLVNINKRMPTNTNYNKSNASYPRSTYSRTSAVSKASENRMRQRIEFEHMQKLDALEAEKEERKKALMEQERLMKLAEVDEMCEQNSHDGDFDDIQTDVSKKNDDRNKRTEDWVHSQQQTNVEKSTENDKIGEALLLMAKLQSQQMNNDDMKLFMKRQVALTPLREFSGKTEEWLGFIQDYRSSSEMCGLTDEENLKRLCKSLRGKAKDLFLEKLKSAEHVPKVLMQMEELFGQPRLIIQSLIHKIKEMPSVRQDKPESMVNFAHAIDNLVDSMKSMKCTGHMNNPQLMDDILAKLPIGLRCRWADLVVDKDSEMNLTDLATFLCKRAKSANVLRNLETDVISNDKEKKVRNNFQDYSTNIPTAAGLLNQNYTNQKKDITEETSKITETETVPVTKDNYLSNHTCSTEVILQTLMVDVLKTNNNKERVSVRALIDTGSQRSFMTKDIVDRMGYNCIEEVKIIHGLFGGVESKPQPHKKYQARVSAKDRDYTCSFGVLDEKEICGLMPKIPNGPWIEELSQYGVKLNDVGNYSEKIDLLLGADVVGKLFTGKIHTTTSGPVAIETSLGWTLMGKVPTEIKSKNDSTLLVNQLFCKVDSIQSLWNLESLGITDPAENKTKSELEDAAMSHFLETVKREEDGRYIVNMPWIIGHDKLPTNKKLAEKRLENATKKLISQNLIKEYEKVFKEWEDEEIIEEVPIEEYNNYGHYLPHRAVVKMSSETTKIRPVFDASAHERGAPSLNNCLHTGPNLLELIPDVLCGFRLKRFGVISDVRKAFLQISVQKEDRDFLRFIWWKNSSSTTEECKVKEENMKIYRHKRVVFGVSSSPFLLGATIHYHLDNVSEKYKKIGKQLKNSFYVDNCVTSLESKKELNSFMDVSKKVMDMGKFDLRGWMWTGMTQEKEDVVPVLGLSWNTTKDTLCCDLRDIPDISIAVTKRNILSVAHRIFDPIGFTSPVTLLPKLLLQQSWKTKTGWDDELPNEIKNSFMEWVKQLPLLKNISIPRWVFHTDCERRNWSLHVFSDASKQAYAACIYLRGETENGISVQLIQAKSRVAPVSQNKDISISRLELMGCCISTRLAASVKTSLDFHDIPSFYWTDSSNAWYWITKQEQWNVFVHNRVKEIRKLSNTENWRHIPGKENPADLPSRGCSVLQLCESSWWEGPEFLKKSEEFWPKSVIKIDEDVVFAEKKKTVNINLLVDEANLTSRVLMTRNYNYQQFLRIIACLLRFAENCKLKMKNEEKLHGKFSLKEMEKAELVTTRLIQLESFLSELDLLKRMKVFKDENNLLRLKTKIVNREDTDLFRCPIILPANHPVVKLLIEDAHIRNQHAGIQTLMCILRESFWIIRARKVIRSVIHVCMRCRRFETRRLESEPSPLSLNRVRDAAVFEITGVDLTGPLYLNGGRKAWICLFTCAVYRAIHLELVSSLSTETFLMAFRRFINRRGRPNTMICDNATNFRGAQNAFRELNWEEIEKTSTVHRIKWMFNAPTAAWWGGFWERMIQMVKKLLRKVLGKSSLKYEELNTVLSDAESTINNRPLTYLSEDSNDLITLTPAIFLNEIKENGVPDLDLLDGKGLNRRMVYRNKVRDDLKKRFRQEYLSLLVQPGGKSRNLEIKSGDIVLVECDQEKRIDWKLGRILEVYPGKGGIIRVVRLKTEQGELIRPTQRLFRLEVHDESRKELIDDLKTTRSGRKVIVPK